MVVFVEFVLGVNGDAQSDWGRKEIVVFEGKSAAIFAGIVYTDYFEVSKVF